MVPDLFFSQLLLVALIWLCVMLQWAWPSDPATGSTTPEPASPGPKRHRERTPCAGLTTKPPCDACEHRSDSRPQTPSSPPPRLVLTRGRRRQVDTSTHFCPTPDCAYRSWVGWGNLRANGPPNGGPWRQLLGVACRRYFRKTLGTLFQGKHTSAERMARVIACLAEGLGIRATARVFEVAPTTVLQWLVETAEHLRAFAAYFLCDLHLEQLQLDELYAVLRELQAGDISDDEAIKRLERSPYWVWTAMDPRSKLLVVVDVGSRTLAMAQRVVHQVPRLLAPGCVPLFLTDGLKDYATALLAHFGHGRQPERRQSKGPMPKPRWMPLPELLYAQVVKSYWRRRIVGVKHRVVFGTRLAIAQVLAACGWTINTAFIERLNLDIR